MAQLIGEYGLNGDWVLYFLFLILSRKRKRIPYLDNTASKSGAQNHNISEQCPYAGRGDCACVSIIFPYIRQLL